MQISSYDWVNFSLCLNKKAEHPLEDFPWLGTPSRAKAHGRRPWDESRGRKHLSRPVASRRRFIMGLAFSWIRN